MSYIKHEFKSGEKLYASELNEMDGQIFKNSQDIVDCKVSKIPKVFFSGDITGMSKDDAKDLKIEYKDGVNDFDGYVEMKWQGSSSLQHPKKNFTIKLFTDSTKGSKLKKNFRGWGEQNKFCLKANYIDHSHARNVVCARLWGDVVASRKNIPPLLKNAPNYGAVDGFPIKVYVNGVYEGIYTWNIPKDGWMFGMTDESTQAIISCERNNSDTPGMVGVAPECQFRKTWNGSDYTRWEWEYPDESVATTLESFNSLITFVMSSSDEDFIDNLDNYLDLESVIDYYLFQYFICGLDCLAKNMLMAYDGTKWYCSAYDMDSTFGLWWTGKKFVDYNFACPEDYQENYSLLWQRVEKLLYPQLQTRYTELRNGALSYTNVIKRFEEFTDVISADLYEEDSMIYTEIPSVDTNNIRQIRTYMKQRGEYVDGCISALDGNSYCDKDGDGYDDYRIPSSLTASFTQGGTVVYENDNLNVLKALLSVSVIYTDGYSEVITDYALSGNLTKGNSTITVSYRGLTTTFVVEVSGEITGLDNVMPLETTILKGGYYYSNTNKKWEETEAITTVMFEVPSGELKIRIRFPNPNTYGIKLSNSYQSVFLADSVDNLTWLATHDTITTTESNGDLCLTVDNTAGKRYCSIPFQRPSKKVDGTWQFFDEQLISTVIMSVNQEIPE